MNLSRAYTIRARQVDYEGVSVGRVMTPTMALVVRCENEIAKFKPVTHYAVKAVLANDCREIPTTWQISDNVASLDREGRLFYSSGRKKQDRESAIALLKLLDKAKTTQISPPSGAFLCLACGKVMVRRKGKNGPFWGCSNHPECKTTARDNKGKPYFTASTT